MAEVSSPDHIVAPRAAGYEPYDATSDAPVAGWDKVRSGPADMSTGEVAGGDWPSENGWRQT
jgi:hypothetical protein